MMMKAAKLGWAGAGAVSSRAGAKAVKVKVIHRRVLSLGGGAMPISLLGNLLLEIFIFLIYTSFILSRPI